MLLIPWDEHFSFWTALDIVGRLDFPYMSAAVRGEEQCSNLRVQWAVDDGWGPTSTGIKEVKTIWTNDCQIVRNAKLIDPSWTLRKVAEEQHKLLKAHIAAWEAVAAFGVETEINTYYYRTARGVLDFLGRPLAPDDEIDLRVLRRPFLRRYQREAGSGAWNMEWISEATFIIRPGRLGVVKQPEPPVAVSCVIEHTYGEGQQIKIEHDEGKRVVRVTTW